MLAAFQTFVRALTALTPAARIDSRSLARTGAMLFCCAALCAGAETDPSVSSWLKAKAQEYREYLQGQTPARPSEAGAKLWRERSPTDAAPLLDFVPPTSLAPLIRSVSRGVVNVSALGAGDPSAEGGNTESLGSGFIISANGYVVTNNHVIEKGRQIAVRLEDGREFSAELVGRDPSTDVALLRLTGSDVRDLPYAFLGNSDKLEVGDWVMAIGNPFGLDHSVSQGIISAKERVIGIGPFDDFIQTDALINPGNSGGPLFNMRGEVVGVNTAIISRGQGIGFAVPINMVKDLLPNLLVNGHLERGWLGVNIYEEPRPAQGSAKGAIINEVFRGSPAALAQIKPGDRLMAVNGRPVESYLQLLRRIAFLPPGTEVSLSLTRGSVVREVRVRLGQRPSPEAAQASPGHSDNLGMVVRDVTPGAGTSAYLKPHSGVVVSNIMPGGPAGQAGLAAGDLITEVNRKPVQDLRTFEAALEETGSDRRVLIRFQRGDTVKYVALSLR
jgi:serine protease Do